MEETGVRKCHAVTARTARVVRRDVIGRYNWLRFEPRLKVILLSCTMGVLGSFSAYAGSSGLPLGANIGKSAPAGSVAAQTAEKCWLVTPWDLNCLLLQPVGTVPGAFPPGPGDREGGPSGHSGPSGRPPGPAGPPLGPPDPGPSPGPSPGSRDYPGREPRRRNINPHRGYSVPREI